MTAPPDGVSPTPEVGRPDASVIPELAHPPRPPMVEAAAAILIVVGVAGIAAQLLALIDGTEVPAAGAEPILVVQYLLIASTIVIGLLVRAGRAWPICVSVATILLLLDLIAVPSGNLFAILFSVLDAVVVVTLLRHKSWFDRRPSAAAMEVEA
jgi:hypothetical protein